MTKRLEQAIAQLKTLPPDRQDAIALANQIILVTRNHRDFNKIPNLSLEDWTIS